MKRAIHIIEQEQDIPFQFEEELQNKIISSADGDARRLLNILEVLVDFSEIKDNRRLIDSSLVESVLAEQFRRFDRGQDIFFMNKFLRCTIPFAAPTQTRRYIGFTE